MQKSLMSQLSQDEIRVNKSLHLEELRVFIMLVSNDFEISSIQKSFTDKQSQGPIDPSGYMLK